MLSRFIQSALGTPIFLIAALFCFQAQATGVDRLATAAVQSKVAVNSLLLDITQAGARLVAVGEQGVILLSDDQGLSWQQSSVPVSVMLTAVSFIDARQGWAVGHDGAVLKTEDGGHDWQLVLDGAQINQLRVTQLQRLYDGLTADPAVSGEQLEALEYQLEDARVALEENATPPLLDVWFRNGQEGYVLGAYGMLLHTSDGGVSWQSLGHQLPNPDGFHLNALLESSRGDLYIAGEAGLLIRSQDLGASWQLQDSPYEGSFFALADSEQLYVMGLRGHLFSSMDGDEWRQEELSVTASLNNAITDGKRLLLVGQGGLLLERTSDGFIPHEAMLRRSLSAAVISGDQLVVVGDGGVNRILLGGGAKQ